MSTSQTTPAAAPPAAPKPAAPAVATSHLGEAQKIVKNNCMWSAGLGLIPIPLADWAAISAIQTRMLRELCKEYGVAYDKARVSRYIGALVGGFIPSTLGYSFASLLKVVPIIGGASFVAVPALAYATTYALGEVFIPHFESGGNLFTFDPGSQASLFAYYYTKGKAAAEAGL